MHALDSRIHCGIRLGREAQGEPVEKDTLFERCMRLLQGFDFEIDHTGGKAASCVAGLLPCLHGPCAFFRFGVIQGRCARAARESWKRRQSLAKRHQRE